MSRITPASADALYDMFDLRPNGEILKFLDRLAPNITADAFKRILAGIDEAEQEQVFEDFLPLVSAKVIPRIVAQGIRLVKECPTAALPDLEAEVTRRVGDLVEEHEKVIHVRASEAFKRGRDRKSNPATIRENVEIVRLRGEDPVKWSLVGPNRIRPRPPLKWCASPRSGGTPRMVSVASNLPYRKLSEFLNRVPGHRRNERLHPSTLARWCSVGVKLPNGTRLPGVSPDTATAVPT